MPSSFSNDAAISTAERDQVATVCNINPVWSNAQLKTQETSLLYVSDYVLHVSKSSILSPIIYYCRSLVEDNFACQRNTYKSHKICSFVISIHRSINL